MNCISNQPFLLPDIVGQIPGSKTQLEIGMDSSLQRQPHRHGYVARWGQIPLAIASISVWALVRYHSPWVTDADCFGPEGWWHDLSKVTEIVKMQNVN